MKPTIKELEEILNGPPRTIRINADGSIDVTKADELPTSEAIKKWKREKVMLAFGEVSMCWDPKPTGCFDSEQAIAIAECLFMELDIDKEAKNGD